jgi:two-component system cell cycle sensor histidine kinase/response regulator CckA
MPRIAALAVVAVPLLVDDERAVRSLIRAMLEREQFRVIEAENGIQAARTVEQLGDAIDLIVSDVQMSGGDGITLALSVRESHPALPIVLMSGFIEPDWKRLPGGSFQFLPKPFQAATLQSAIRNAIQTMTLRKMGRPQDPSAL